MSELPADPFAGVPTEVVVDLVLAGETLPPETRQTLCDMADQARRSFPAAWASRFAEAYKTGLRERWARELREQWRGELLGGC